ncbi:MAG: BamA/TamA family outer membrane protein, partial [Myxococcota bacterium]|nr:BamA/TamA family outer membrane protein [Myxococcota bacterium]
MVIRLDEHPNIFMTIAGALTTDEGAQLRFSSGHRNLFGLGHKLSFVGQAGFGWDGEGWLLDRYAPDWRTSIRYTAPRLPIKQGSFFTELVLREQIQESNFRLYRSGLKAGVSLSINQNWRMLVEYGIQRVDIDDYDQGLLITGDPWIEILSTRNHRWSSGGTLSTIWDGRDSPFNPKKGGFASLGLSVTDGLLGMASSVQALSNWSYNWDLQQFRFRVSNSNGLAVMRNEETLPFDQRFFLGGANSLRGFSRNSVGPTNYVLRPEIAFPTQIGPAIESSSLRENPAQWIPTGGDLFYTLSLEALYPLTPFELEHISIITFCDLGYLGFQNETLQTDSILEGDESIRYGVGVGLRWLTSVGPISLDLGINPAHLSERGESLFTPYFSFGNN